jgi:hypothetical protein
MSSAAAAAASRSKLKQQALFARIPLQPTTNAAAPRLHLLCSRVRFSGQGRVKHHSMTNLRLPPPCALPCTARGGCSLAKATPPRGACGPTRTALQPPSLFNRSACTLPTATPPGLAHVAVGCSISSAPHAPAPLLYTRTPSAYSPAPSPAISSMARLHPCHADATRMQRRPLPLHSPAQHTRRCAVTAPRNNAARVAKATMDLFRKTNEM